MTDFDEKVAKGIYIRKCWGSIFHNFGIVLIVSLGILLSGLVIIAFPFIVLTLYGMLWSGLSFSDIFSSHFSDTYSSQIFSLISLSWLYIVFLFLLLYSIKFIKYYFCKINCWAGLDKKKICVVGYFRSKKIEKTIDIKDVKKVEWTQNYFSYKNKRYAEFTLHLKKDERIKNIPVECESDLYHFLKDLNKA